MPPRKILYTGGTFDLFHSGHANFLKQCHSYGNVIVSLNTDEFIKSYKGKAPIMTYQERKAVLESCKYVWMVIENSGGADSRPAIELAQPDIVAIGSDWARRDYHAQMGFTQDWLDDLGIDLLYIPYTQGISTTELKSRLKR